MTQTMTKPKVKQAKIEVEESTPKLRFKITNTRATLFPGPLTETDYFQWKVGDLLSNSYNSTTIYEVVEISRDMIHSTELSNWTSRLYTTRKQSDNTLLTESRDQKATNLLDKYKQSGNFGVCRIKLKTVLRGANVSQRNSFKYVKELAVVRAVNYNGYVKVDLEEMLKRRENNITKLTTQVNRYEARRQSAVKQRDALQQVKNTYFPPEKQPIPLLNENCQPDGELNPNLLL